MQVEINGNGFEVSNPAGLRMSDLLAALAVHIEPGDVLTQVELDGESFAASDGRLAWTSVDEGATVRLTTVPGRVLGQDLREDVRAALTIVAAKVNRAAELYGGGATSQAHELLSQLLEELQLTLVLDGQAAQLAGTPRLAEVESVEGIADDLLQAQEARDHARLAGILERGLGPLLQTWRSSDASPE